MSDTAIRVENLGKRYRIAIYKAARTLRDTLMDGLRARKDGCAALTPQLATTRFGR